MSISAIHRTARMSQRASWDVRRRLASVLLFARNTQLSLAFQANKTAQPYAQRVAN